MPEQQFQPLWSKKQLQQFTSLYEGRGHLLSPEYKQKIDEHAAYYNVPFYEGETGFLETIKAAGQGFTEAMTLNLYQGDKPKTQTEAIAKNIGHLIGFAPAMLAGPLGKIASMSKSRTLAKMAGLAAQGNKISPSMIAADYATKKAATLGNATLASAGLKNVDALKGAQKLIFGGGARNISHQAFHLGVASAAGTLPEILKGNLDVTMDAFMGGAKAGAIFGSIGNITGPALQKSFQSTNPKTLQSAETTLKTIAGSVAQGSMAAGHGATTPELVYEYLLGAYFGGNAAQWHNSRAQKVVSKIQKKGLEGTKAEKDTYKEWDRTTGRDIESHPDMLEEPASVKKAAKELQSQFGDPTENLARAHLKQLAEEAGLKVEDLIIEVQEKTPEGFIDKGEYVDGRATVEVKESTLKRDNYIATTGTEGDAILAEITGQYGLPSINYVPFRGAKDKVVGLDRVLTEDQLQEANSHISKANKSIRVPSKDKETGKPTMIPLPIAELSQAGRDSIAKNYWAIKNAKEVYLVTEMGGNPNNKFIANNFQKWPAQFAKDLNKPLFILDSSSNRWFKWNKQVRNYEALGPYVNPPKPSNSIAVLGTNNLAKGVSPEIYKSMHGWLGKHFKKRPIADEIQKRANAANKAKVKDIQDVFTRQAHIKEELNKLEGLEESDELIAHRDVLNKNLAETEQSLLKIEEETTTDFLQKAIQDHVKVEEEVAGVDEFGTEQTRTIYKKPLQITQDYFEEFWGSKAGIESPYDQRTAKLEMSERISDIMYNQFSEKGSKINRSEEAIKAIEDLMVSDYQGEDFQKQGFKLSEAGRGEIRQAITRENLGKAVIHLQSDGVNFFRMKDDAHPVTRAGTRKLQNEPEKYIETVFKDITGDTEPMLFTLDHVTTYNEKRGFNVDMELSRFRATDPKGYAQLVKNASKKAAKEGMYVFGGASDKDRLYFIKYHPESDKLTMRDLIRSKVATSKDLRLSREQSRKEHDLTTEEHDKAFMSNVAYDLSMNGLSVDKAGLAKFMETTGNFVKGSAPFNKRAQIWFTNSYKADREFVKQSYRDVNNESLLNANDKYNVIIVKDLQKKLKDYGLNSLDNIQNPEHVDGAIIVPDRLIDVINRDFGVPESGQNKSFIVSPNAEHGALLGKYMMHAAGPEMSKLMEAQGLHMIMQESAVKQRGTREIGDYDIVNGKLDIKAKTYEISPEDVRGSYSVYGNDHFFEAQRIPKQVMMNMLESVDNPMDQAVIDKAFDDIIGSRWRGQDEYNNKLTKYIADSANKPESVEAMKDIIDNIESVAMRDIVDAIRNESTPQLAEAIYQKMLKVTKENVAAEHRDGSISDADYKGYMAELTEFNSLTDRMIKQATIVSEEARVNGYNVTADAIYNHKIIRDFKAKAVQNFLVNSATKPHMGNSGAAYMRPYDKAMQVNLDKVNDLLDKNNVKGINKNDEVFFLDNGHASRKIHLLNAKGTEYSRTLEQVFNEFKTAKGDRLDYLTEVLTAATVRVPMDSVSGMQIMKFGGFTGRKGHGILLHSKAMRAEGGADLDGDKAFYYFGGTRGMSKDMMEQFYKNKNEFEYIENGESYTKDNKKAKISKKVGKYQKGTPIRDLLISQIKTGSDKDKMELANSSTSHYAPAERIRISEAAVDGRNQLGPAVSNSQLMKGAYNSIVAAGGHDVLEFGTYIKDADGKKLLDKNGNPIYKNFKVAIKAKTSKEDVKFQRDMARAQLGLASDPMDELGLAGINSWKKLLWDAHFEAVEVKEKGRPGKSKYAKQIIEQLANSEKLKFSYTNSGLFGDFVNLNKGLWGRDYTEGRKYNMDEIHNFLGSATNIMNREGASNSFLPKIGHLFSGLDWSDSPFVRLNEGRIAQTYAASNKKIGSRLYLQELLGRSSMKVPYTKQIQNIFEHKLFDSIERIDIANDIDRFYDAIKGTTYEKRAKRNKEELESEGGYKTRLNMLNEMLRESEDFIVNDVTDMVTLNIVEDIMTKNKIAPERFIEISKQVDYLKKNSYLMARDRSKLEAFIEEAPETELSKLLENYYVEKFGAKPKTRTSKDTSRTAEMDQSEIDSQIEAFRAEKGLNKAENELFDQLMLGSINRGKQLDKIIKMESEIKNWKNGVARDYIKYLRDLNSKSNISRLGFSSMAVDDASIRRHLKGYMEMMNENSIPLTKAELNDLNVALGKTVDTPPAVPETVQKMATNTGFEHIDFKAEPVKSKELSSLIAETGELLRLHPNIVGDKSGKALNEFTRGLPFIRKDFDAMDIADIHKLNIYLKQTKEGTIWQRAKKMFGKDEKALSWRSYQQLPSTTNRELMATDIDLVRKEGYFTDAQGEIQAGKIRVPTQFMDTLSNGIGNMIEMGTQVGDGLVGRFQEEQMFYQGLEEAAGFWEVAIRQREYDGRERYRVTREEHGKSASETEQSIIYMREKLNDAHKGVNWTEAKKKEYFVNLDGQRIKMTGEDIVKRINTNLTKYMEEMHTIIRGKEEMRGDKSPYFIEWYDPLTKKSPKYNHNAFLKDLDIYLNGRVPKRWKGLMKSTTESIPSIFGIDGVRSMMREMHIDFLMQISRSTGEKEYAKKAIKLAQFPVKETGQLPFENYFPRMFFEPSIVKENLKKANDRIINDKTMTEKSKLKELIKIQQRHKRLDGDYTFDEMQDGELYDNLLDALKNKEEISDKRMENWFSLDVSMGNMRSREYSTPGWSVAPTAVEAYVRSLSNTYFKGLAGMVSRNIVSNPKTGIYQKLKGKWGVDNALAWTEYAKLYVNDALGNPVTITDKMMNDPKMALKYSPYKMWADNRLSKRVAKVSAKLGLKGIVEKDGTVLGGVDMYDLRRWSQMEAKFEMAALLAHPKSVVANILGGSIHTIQSAGLTAYRNVHNYEYLQSINPALKSRKDVDDMVINHGVLPQWMIYELGLQKEFQSNEGKEALKVISNIIKRDPNISSEDMVAKAKVGLGTFSRSISDKITTTAAKFMTVPERRLRTDAFMAHYLKAWESFGGAIKDPNHPFLIEMGKKGVAATQFLYNAPHRPAYARTSLGKVMTRFQMYAWNSVRLRGDMMRKLEIAGYDPNSAEGREAQRFLGVDMFMLALANMFPYSLFENNLPQPFGWFQDTADWIFGNEQERDRAFFGTYPTAVAPLQAITPPIGRVGLLIEGILNGDMERVSNYYIWTMFPFGRIARDVVGKGGIAEAPIRLVDKLTGIPLTQIQRKVKRMREDDLDILYPKAFTGGYE